MSFHNNTRGGQAKMPVNFMTKLEQCWPMKCQWNTERVSHFHQGSQHWESWNSQKLGHHHRGQTRSAYQATALDNWGVSPQRQDTERMSSYRFRYNNDGPWNASGTRSAYPTVTRVANIRSPGTPKIGASPQRQDTGRVSSYRFRYTPASPCNASGTRSACPTTTRIPSISPINGQVNRSTWRNCNNIMAETKHKRWPSKKHVKTTENMLRNNWRCITLSSKGWPCCH